VIGAGVGKRKILVVEDHPTVREVLRTLLGMEDYEVAVAPNGEAGLALADILEPDVVILDVSMPGLNGYEVCRAIKSRASDTRIVMVTARTSEEDERVGREAGADAYLRKPFSPLDILEAVGLGARTPK
jgi:two-component system, OmpR family, phosphate regulon response regulator PhoB